MANTYDTRWDDASVFPEFAAEEPRRSIFENATGIFPSFDAAAPKSGLHRMLSSVFGTPARRAERRARPAQVMGPVDPQTGERFQFWPERLARSAATLGGDVASGAVPAGVGALGLRPEDYTDVPGHGNPAEVLMERAQDLAGILGGGPLTAPRGSASLASGAKRPPIGDAAMPSRRSLFTLNRPKLEIPVESSANLPAVQDPLARLMQGPGDLPTSNRLLDQLQAPPAPSANALSAVAQVPVDRRELLRGAGAVAANASRAGRVAEALMKPAETVAAPTAALPKFEEIWKKGEPEFEYHHRAYDRAMEAADEALYPKFEEEHPEFKDFNYDKATRKQARRYEDAMDDFRDEHNKEWNAVHDDHLASYEEPLDESGVGGTQYHDYQLPGGDNYRELLIKHPEGQGEAAAMAFEDKLKKKYGDDWRSKNKELLTTDEHKQWQDLYKKWNDDHASMFQSSSWDEPNVLGHLRMHDRDIPGVGKALHLEELNSEWHQQGAKEGYGGSKKDIPPNTSHNQAIQAPMRGVPDAPLKDSWPDYLLRRAIKEAVEQGHDAVSWTPGTHQAQRYDDWAGNPNSPKKSIEDFYDKHLVDRANDIGKQYGTKVEQHDIGDVDMMAPSTTQEGRPSAPLPVLRITPQLRKAVKDGSFSLLSDSGKPGAALAALEHAQPFYSAAERAVQFAKLDKGSPEQWLGYLRNQPGVRKEELEHLGLEEALKGKKQLTKQEMLAHAKERAPQIKEVWKHGDQEFDPAHAGELAHDIMERNHPDLTPEHAEYFGHFDDALAQAHEELGFNENGPKFPDYQLPGGDNYREMLLTLPSKSHYAGRRDKPVGSNDYTSSHWDEPNVLAHARMNDRMIHDTPEGVSHASGKPVMTGGPLKSLHLEELQSDWHQKGRKEGYQEQLKGPTSEQIDKVRQIMANLKEKSPSFGGTIENDGSGWSIKKSAPMWLEQHKINPGQYEVIQDYLKAKDAEFDNFLRVPDAPFKQTWPDLLLKRLVHEAAAKGYDSISWTPGEAQAARYDLSKHVHKLELIHNKDGVGELKVYPKGREFNRVQIHSKQDLVNNVGKDLADKLYEQGYKNNGIAEMSGLDLKVGGEGMRQFYDKMLVDKANALGKKHGAKVEWQPLHATGLKLRGVGNQLSVEDAAGRVIKHFVFKEDAHKFIKQGGDKIPVLRLTPQLREAVLKEGFPLFSAALPFGALDEGVRKK